MRKWDLRVFRNFPSWHRYERLVSTGDIWGLDVFGFLTSVQRTVGVEKAEGRGELLLDLRPRNPNRREAQGAGRLLPVLVGAPTQKRRLLRDFLGFISFIIIIYG